MNSSKYRRSCVARLAALIALVAVCVPSATALQDARRGLHRVRIWTTESGLPQGSANDLLQTPDGALWIATFGGLLRFDGLQFRIFDLETLPELPSVRITGLDSDGGSGLWLLTQTGEILHYRDGAIEESLVLPAQKQELVAFVRDANGGLWVRGSAGTLWLHRNGQWSQPLMGRWPRATYANMCATMEGGIAFASDRQLVRVLGDELVGEPLEAQARITSLTPGAAGVIWVGMTDSIARADLGTIRPVPVDPPLEGSVTALLEDRTGGLWIGTTSGLVHAVPHGASGRLRQESDSFVLPEGFWVQSLLLDVEGNLWVGSRAQGLARLTRRRVEQVNAGATAGSVAALCSDGEDGAWVSFVSGIVGHVGLDLDAVGIPRSIWTIAEHPNTFSLLCDQDHVIWFGQERQLVRRAPDATALEIDLPSRLGSITQTSDGSLWISASSGQRLVRMSRTGDVLESIPVEDNIISMVSGPDGGLWIGSKGVVVHRGPGKVTRYARDEGIPQGDVRDILPEPDGSAWIATYGGGLAYLHQGRVVGISRIQGLPNNALSRILEDGEQRLWLLSNQGLIVAARDDLMALVEGRISRFDPVVLGPEAGMPEGNYGSPAGFRDARGRLWFGTTEGPVCIDPAHFPFNRTPPRINVERVMADEVEIGLANTVQVPAGTRRVVVEYTSFALTAPERVHYRYRLSGFDDRWQEHGPERSVAYTGLGPGQYAFEVLARNEDGVWSAAPASVLLRVAPSWWETNLFRTAIIFAALAALYAFDRVRIGIIRRRAGALLEATEGRARAEERESRLRDDLAHVGRVATAGELATSLAHEVNQPLAAIVTNAQAGRRYLSKDAVNKDDMEAVLRDISEQGQRASDIIQRLREFLRKHKSERRRIDLNQVVRDTLPLVRRELQDHRVTVVLDLDDDGVAVEADPIQIQQIVVNLVNNACEAMSRTKSERRVTLHTTRTDTSAVLEVSDTGPGIAPEVAERLFKPYVTTKATGMGLGLAICRSIVEAHGGRITAASGSLGGVIFHMELPARDNGVASK